MDYTCNVRELVFDATYLSFNMSDDFWQTPKPPRDYAAEIVRLKSRDERRAALERVPPAYRDMVRKHVENTLLLAWHWQRRISERPCDFVPESVWLLLDAVNGKN